MRNLILLSIGLLFYNPARIVAQDIPDQSTIDGLFVFMDCNARNCDFDHFRREIPWVDWVRDRQDSDLHLLITSQSTGGGGLTYTLDYIGRRVLEGTDTSIKYTSDPNDTDTEVRNRLTETIALGLIQFVINDPNIVSKLSINYEGGAALTDQVTPEEDPWNLWVFRLGIEGSIEGESTQEAYSLEGNVRARRISEDLKIEIEADAEYDKEKFDDVEQGESFTNTSEDYTAGALVVWSLGPHWSAGGGIEFSRSTFVNRDLAIFGGPGIEYNIFPYSESTRRAILFRYFPEAAYFNYELITVEGKTSETQYRHTLQLRAEVQQEWGEIFGFVEGIQYFNDLSTHRINTFVSIEYRLFRGFNIDLFFQFSRIKDQFFLPAGGLTPGEILLRRRQRETDFVFDFGIGFSYRFGSKFANIVNPRMGN